MKNKLPNFLIVGAAKSGTSSLYNYLNQHPQVFMPTYNKDGMKVKEPYFLIKDVVSNRLHNGVWNWSDYKALFNDVRDEIAVGEATVLYLYYYKHAIENIKKRLGNDIKIIIILRNPIERAFSAYTHVSRGVKENLSFENALKIEENRLLNDHTLTPMVMYKDMGLYSEMVKAYLDNFKNVRVIFYEDFTENTAKVVEDTLSFLGVTDIVDLDTDSKYNVGGKRWKSSFLKRFFMQDNPIKKPLRILLPKKLRIYFRSFVESVFKKKVLPISKGTRKALIKFFIKDINKLEELLNVNLNHWKR
tara:strand:- start:717 stop:1625 length:909 start_codon:yes stop_codon:yes gene_type:complete